MIAFLLLLLQYGPSIIGLVTEIWELLEKLRATEPSKAEWIERTQLKTAVAVYRRSKDRRPLRELRDSLHMQCYGEKCST